MASLTSLAGSRGGALGGMVVEGRSSWSVRERSRARSKGFGFLGREPTHSGWRLARPIHPHPRTHCVMRGALDQLSTNYRSLRSGVADLLVLTCIGFPAPLTGGLPKVTGPVSTGSLFICALAASSCTRNVR